MSGTRMDDSRLLEHVREKLPDAAVNWPNFAPTHESRMIIWDGRAGIDVRARPHRDGRVVTVTLYNRLELDTNVPPHMRTRERVSKSLFEARLECVIESGDLVEYPRVEPSLLTEESRSLSSSTATKTHLRHWPRSRRELGCEFEPKAEDLVGVHARSRGADDDRRHQR